MELVKKISILKNIALLLFIFGSLSILCSLIFHNYLVAYKIGHPLDYGVLSIEDKPGSSIQSVCDESNKYCTSRDFIKNNKAPKAAKLSDCFVYTVKNVIVIDDKIYEFYEFLDALEFILIDGKNISELLSSENKYNSFDAKLKKDYEKSEIRFIKKVSNEKNIECIKNTKFGQLYKIFPFWYEYITKLKSKNITLGTSKPVNPFIYGETSISNIAKRFPINFIFKGFLYISVILMFIYWRSYNYLFDNILNQKRNFFYYFGISSAIFLFLHVFFLGSEIDNETFQKIRRLIMVLFILNELFAQISLTRQLYLNSSKLSEYCYLSIIKLKILFIFVILIVSSIVILILIFYNLSSKIDYILEWNYFLILLFYYFLSSIMWKKIYSNL